MADEVSEQPPRLSVRIAGRLIAILIVVGAAVTLLYVTWLYYLYPRTDDAYVRANVVGVRAACERTDRRAAGP